MLIGAGHCRAPTRNQSNRWLIEIGITCSLVDWRVLR